MKPVVRYDPSQPCFCIIGLPALVFAVGQAASMLTGKVIRIGEKGEFETLNTVYKPKRGV